MDPDNKQIWCDKCRVIIRKGVTMIKDDNSTLDFCFDCCLVFFRPSEHKHDKKLRNVLKQEEKSDQVDRKLDEVNRKLDLLVNKEKDNPPNKFTFGTPNPNPNPSTSCFPLNDTPGTLSSNFTFGNPPNPANNFTLCAPKPSLWSNLSS